MKYYLESKGQSAELLRLTLPQMARQDAAYHPVSYTLWYEHLAGINPPLSAALTARLALNRPLTEEEVCRLYMRHVSTPDAAVLDRLQQHLQGLLDEAAQTFNTAGEDTGQFARTLRASRADLSEESSAAKVRQVIARLLSEAQRMETVTQVLSEQLAGRSEEVKALTQQLAQAQTEALLDPLCGIANRRGFARQARAALEGDAGPHGCALVLAVVDDFQQLNDRYGHLLGDKVLRALAAILRRAGGGSIAARLGGERFALLLPKVTLEEAQAAVARLGAAVAKVKILRDQSTEVVGTFTVSFGIAAGAAGDTLDTLMFQADQALAAAQRAGRSRLGVEALAPCAPHAQAADLAQARCAPRA